MPGMNLTARNNISYQPGMSLQGPRNPLQKSTAPPGILEFLGFLGFLGLLGLLGLLSLLGLLGLLLVIRLIIGY
jgi:hypothetical protein